MVLFSVIDHLSSLTALHALLVGYLRGLLRYWQGKAEMLLLAPLILLGGTTIERNTTSQPFIGVVPRPAEYTVGNSTICLSADFRIGYDGDHFPRDLITASDALVKVLKATTHRYLSVERGAEFFVGGQGCQSYIDELVLSVDSKPCGPGGSSSIFVAATQPVELRPELERYSLYLGTNNTATLSSGSGLGLFRGLATFGQLFYKHGDKLYAPFGPYEIHDKPAFGWRAVLLDTSRHYFPTDVLKRQLDIMAMVKLNVFHW
jgi:hexosaminidase